MLPERRSTVVSSSSYLNPSGHNDNSFLLLRRGKKFGRIVKLKLSHLFLFFVSLFFFSCMFSGHKLLFHGSEFLPHFEQNPYMKSHMLVSSEIDIGSNKSNIERPPGSKKRTKHLPCEVPLAESVDRILDPQDYLNFTRFSLGFVETETYDKPRFGGHQTLKERERSYSAINQTIHCGFVKGTNGFHQGTGFDLSEMDRAYMKNCVVSVSSCIFGSSDFLRRPATKKISEFSKRNVCFVMFVDEQTLLKLASEGHVPDKQGFVGLWKTVVVSNLPYSDMRKTGKVPKFLSHRLFPSSRYSIWLDSKMRLTTDPMLIIDFFLWRTKSEFAISNHYDRHCVWDEVLQNKRLNKYILMATVLTTAIDVCFNPQNSDTKKHNLFLKPSLLRQSRTRKLNISCSSLKQPKTLEEEPITTKTPSLSEQLKPLSATTLRQEQTQILSKPKSVWVNPTRPKRSVLSLQRQKRSAYSYNPQIKDLRAFAQKLNSSNFTEKSEFLSLLDEIPHPPDRDNALLVLNSLREWQKTHTFFNWVKSKNLFPMETIFYNVTMKSLRFGRQFHLIEEMALEMVKDGVELDNITYSTIITCAKRCNFYDKAIEWFERMYKTGLMPDEVTYSAILDVYSKLRKVEEVLSLYERAVATGWKPDAIAFSVLGKMFGEAGDYDGIRYVLQEMKSMDVKPNVVVYNTLLEAMGRAGKPGLARSLFNEMLEAGLTPNEKTLTALVKIYGKARWAKDALQLWEEMKAKKWPMDFILYNTLLNMCADIGLEEEAERLFNDMKESVQCKPDNFSYTAMLNIYGSGGKAEKAMKLFEEMLEAGVQVNVMGCTCLVQCLGKAKRIDDLVYVFDLSIQRGVKPDDRLCGCLLSVMALCESSEDAEKVMACLERANQKLVTFVKLIVDEKTEFETVKEEFKLVINATQVEARRPFCNCLIDICRGKKRHERAHELLYLGTLFGLYPGLHNKTIKEWSLDVRSLSVGAAETALEEWMRTLANIVKRQEDLPELFLAQTGTGTHRFSQGLANSFALHLQQLSAPFRQSDRAGIFVATKEDLVSWLESKFPPLVTSQA